MLNKVKIVISLLLLVFLSGCGTVVKYLDSSWNDDKTVYDKSQSLPPLEISPELGSNPQTH